MLLAQIDKRFPTESLTVLRALRYDFTTTFPLLLVMIRIITFTNSRRSIASIFDMKSGQWATLLGNLEDKAAIDKFGCAEINVLSNHFGNVAATQLRSIIVAGDKVQATWTIDGVKKNVKGNCISVTTDGKYEIKWNSDRQITTKFAHEYDGLESLEREPCTPIVDSANMMNQWTQFKEAILESNERRYI